MKHVLSIMLLVCSFAMTAMAQNEKFGKPSKEEWELKSVSFAPEAEAVVLYKSVDVSYKVKGAFTALGSGGEGSLDDNRYAATGVNKYASPENTTMLYDVKVRIKVLKESGKGFAALDIISYNEKEDMDLRDDFYEMSVIVFSQVDGKVKKKRVSGSSIKDERIDDHYCIRHIRIPEVKVGDIVEYQYTLFSSRCTYIFDTQLQENIPVMYAKCKMEIPFFLQFNVNRPITDKVTASAARGNILIPSANNDKQLPRKIASNIFTIEARELPAYAGEITLKNLSSGEVHCVRTELQDKRYDVKADVSGPVRHLIIGK